VGDLRRQRKHSSRREEREEAQEMMMKMEIKKKDRKKKKKKKKKKRKSIDSATKLPFRLFLSHPHLLPSSPPSSGSFWLFNQSDGQ